MTEQIRKTKVTPTAENHEADRMLNEAEQRQRREAAKTAGKVATEEMDALLDEIDEVLEENAETFVKEYVQKGGQ